MWTTAPPMRTLAPPQVDVGSLQHGLVVERYFAELSRALVISVDKTLRHWNEFIPKLALRWDGFLQIVGGGIYQFHVTAVGFTELQLDGVTLARTPANQNLNTSNNTGDVELLPGFHSFSLLYSEQGGRAGIVLDYEGPDTQGDMILVPPRAFYHKRAGPCVLSELQHVASPPCDDPARWALGDGDSCNVLCRPGYYVNGIPNATQAFTCQAGALSPSATACARLACFAPDIVNGGAPSCEEGPVVQSGGVCTARCADGYLPNGSSAAALLSCKDGVWHGSFLCEVPPACPLPIRPPYASQVVCDGNQSEIPSGEQCVALCSAGYQPSSNLTCSAGAFVPPTFECRSFSAGAQPVAPHAPDAVVPEVPRTPDPHYGLPEVPGIPGTPDVKAFPAAQVVLGVLALVAACVLVGLCFTGQPKKSRDVLWSDSEASRSYNVLTDVDEESGRRGSRYVQDHEPYYDSRRSEEEAAVFAASSVSPSQAEESYASEDPESGQEDEEEWDDVPPDSRQEWGEEEPNLHHGVTHQEYQQRDILEVRDQEQPPHQQFPEFQLAPSDMPGAGAGSPSRSSSGGSMFQEPPRLDLLGAMDGGSSAAGGREEPPSAAASARGSQAHGDTSRGLGGASGARTATTPGPAATNPERILGSAWHPLGPSWGLPGHPAASPDAASGSGGWQSGGGSFHQRPAAWSDVRASGTPGSGDRHRLAPWSDVRLSG